MLFDYLVAISTQKLEKIEDIEIACKIEKIRILGKKLIFWKNRIFFDFAGNFNLFYIFKFLN